MILTIVLQDITTGGKWVMGTQDLSVCESISQDKCLIYKNETYVLQGFVSCVKVKTLELLTNDR